MKLDERLIEQADYIVVGTGFCGSVVARELAEKKNKKVVMLERRKHIAGNMFDEVDDQGIRVQRYGIHVIHTNDENVINYIGQFTQLKPYKVFCKGWVNDRLVPIPFNFKSIDLFFEETYAKQLKQELQQEFLGREQIPVRELLDSQNEMVRKYGNFLFEHDFRPYTAKQWGVPPESLDASILARVPIELTENCDYFTAKYQFMPKNGFTEIFENMLSHPNIQVYTKTDLRDVMEIRDDRLLLHVGGKMFDKPILYTGPLDELFGCALGKLPYRSLRFDYETHQKNFFQEAPFVAYPATCYDYTRIIEFKHFTGVYTDNEESTTIMKEYPLPYDAQNAQVEPYYPLLNEENKALHEQYIGLAKKISNLIVGGRLADYKYYYMYEAILRGLELFHAIEKRD